VAASPRPPAGPQRHRNLVPSSFVRESLGCFPAFSEALGSAKQAWTVTIYALPSKWRALAAGKTLASKNGPQPTFLAYTRAVLIVRTATVRADDPLP